jgi:hypothetical protein
MTEGIKPAPMFSPYWFWQQPKPVQDEVMNWLNMNGVDPNRCAGFDVIGQVVVAQMYELGPDGRGIIDEHDNMKTYIREFIAKSLPDAIKEYRIKTR